MAERNQLTFDVTFLIEVNAGIRAVKRGINSQIY